MEREAADSKGEAADLKGERRDGVEREADLKGGRKGFSEEKIVTGDSRPDK